MTKLSTEYLQKELDSANQALHELQASHEKFLAIFEFSNDAIFLIDPESDSILEANTKACEMLGYPINELLKLPMSAVHPEEIPKLMEFAAKVISAARCPKLKTGLCNQRRNDSLSVRELF